MKHHNLVLVRHAQSHNNKVWFDAAKKYERGKITESVFDEMRDKDPQLSDIGYMQANNLGAFLLQRYGSDVELISSPMRRAVETMMPYAKLIDAGPDNWNVYHNLYEHKGCFHMGNVFPGNTKADLERMYPVRCHGMDRGWYYGWDHMETLEECSKRAREIIDWMTTDLMPNMKKTTVMVLHGTLMDQMLKVLFWMDGHAAASQTIFAHNNTAVTELLVGRAKDKQYVQMIKAINNSSHIPAHLLTGGGVLDGWLEVLEEAAQSKL